MSANAIFQKVSSSMSDSERRCSFPRTIQSQRTHALLFLITVQLVVPTETIVPRSCDIPQNSKALLEVFKSGSHSFNKCLCFGNLMHHNSLGSFAFFTQVKGCQQAIAHEHSPNRVIDGTYFQLVNIFPKF